ncbi:hypothetical protein GIB67_024073 [Kingdonia uniflora]|uniref:CCHC-type domain-containing protein n=1 Tax=Kingdonia uniflora TaxID=39325 RepID=A0A7J7MMJ5_9MAGN|nr:hypothetical protein GIB67_024073 [Kingdonia uniflora]
MVLTRAQHELHDAIKGLEQKVELLFAKVERLEATGVQFRQAYVPPPSSPRVDVPPRSSYATREQHKNQGIEDTSNGTGKQQQRPNIRCFNCQNKGHIAKECIEPKNPLGNSQGKRLMIDETQGEEQIIRQEKCPRTEVLGQGTMTVTEYENKLLAMVGYTREPNPMVGIWAPPSSVPDDQHSPSIRCFKCHNKGHTVRECLEPKSPLGNSSEKRLVVDETQDEEQIIRQEKCPEIEVLGQGTMTVTEYENKLLAMVGYTRKTNPLFNGVTASLCGSLTKMSSFMRFNNFSPKIKNTVVAGGLTSFVFGVYFYTMRAVGGTDELQVAIDKFEDQNNKEIEANLPSKA